ncbi:MAG: gliding motility-associated C-terminal domain-containing protein, partial [Cytophagales bacterium]|nr:gliding motility-associated C-terminal domain-containing protein [Cytophagales bacterium]
FPFPPSPWQGSWYKINTFNVGFGYNSKVVINTTNVNQAPFTLSGQVDGGLPSTFQSGLDSISSNVSIHPVLNSDVFMNISASGANMASNIKFTVDGNSNIIPSSVSVLQNGTYKTLAPGYFSIANGNNISFYKKPRPLFPDLPISTNLINGVLKPSGQNFIITLPSGLTNPILSIYDKNGILVSSINGLQWDGTSSGVPVTTGTYKYSLTFLDSASSPVSYEGQLILQ